MTVESGNVASLTDIFLPSTSIGFWSLLVTSSFQSDQVHYYARKGVVQHLVYVACARPLFEADEYTHTHEVIKGTFLMFHKDADQIYLVASHTRASAGKPPRMYASQ
jgi:hypothetical protein